MNAQGIAGIDWRRSIRLIGALRLSKPWQEAAVVVLICLILMAGNISALDSETSRGVSNAGFMIGMMTFLLVLWTGIANAGWLYLPVSDRERRAAAWLIVSVVPLLFVLASCLLAAAAIGIAGRPVDLDSGLSLFGFHGLVAQAMALAAILFGTWPQTLAGFNSLSQRKPNDWVMASSMVGLFVTAAFFGGRFAANGGMGAPLAFAALAASAILLPLTLRFARLEPKAGAEASAKLAWYERRRFSGYRGFFALEAGRSVGFTLLMLASVLFMSWMLPFTTFADNNDDNGLPMAAAFSSSWIGPRCSAP